MIQAQFEELANQNAEQQTAYLMSQKSRIGYGILNFIGEKTVDFVDFYEWFVREHPYANASIEYVLEIFRLTKKLTSITNVVFSGNMNIQLSYDKHNKYIERQIQIMRYKYEEQAKNNIDRVLHRLVQEGKITEKASKGLQLIAHMAIKKTFSYAENKIIYTTRLPLNLPINVEFKVKKSVSK